MWKLISIFAVAFLFLPALTHAQDTTLSLSYNRQGVLKTAYSLQLRQSGECTYVGVRDVVFPDTIRFRIGADTAQELLAEALRLFDHPNPESPEPDMYVDNSMNVTAVLRLGESDLAGKKMLSFPEGVHDKGAWLLFQRLKYATRVLRWTGTTRDLFNTTDHVSLRPIYAKKSRSEIDKLLVHKMSEATRKTVTHFASQQDAGEMSYSNGAGR